jgi:hypothetical protein
METEVVCPYCKKLFVVDVVVRHNEYMGKDQPPVVQEIGIRQYKKKE